jgi:hypothetical protein
MADKYGRKMALQFAGLVTVVGCVIQASASGSIAAMFPSTFPRMLPVPSVAVSPVYTNCSLLLELVWPSGLTTAR